MNLIKSFKPIIWNYGNLKIFYLSRRCLYEQTRTGSVEMERRKLKKLYPREWDRVKDAFKTMIDEFRWLFNILKNNNLGAFRSDNKIIRFEDEEIVKVWDFDQRNNGRISSLYLDYKKNKLNDMDNFQVSCDSDFDIGYSKCSWTVSPSGRALFSGYLDKTLPKDGKIIRTGYAFLSSYKSRGPFFFDDTHPDFEKFTHFVCRVRGDGRRYFVTFDVSQSLDYTWFFRYKYMLYTHGGPYWQYVKIPLTRFFLEYQGYVQDEQYVLDPIAIRSVGILATDSFSGDFSLEIDYIGFVYESQFNDIIEYEGYYHESAKWKSYGGL